MKKILIVLLAVIAVTTSMARPAGAVLPWFPTLKWHADTLHVTTSEKGWALSAESWGVLIINDTTGWLHYRFDTDAAPMYSLLGISGSGPVPPPFVIPAPVDSVFIDAEVAGTVYVEWYAVP